MSKDRLNKIEECSHYKLELEFNESLVYVKCLVCGLVDSSKGEVLK